jgi:hypothetical protein
VPADLLILSREGLAEPFAEGRIVIVFLASERATSAIEKTRMKRRRRNNGNEVTPWAELRDQAF